MAVFPGVKPEAARSLALPWRQSYYLSLPRRERQAEWSIEGPIMQVRKLGVLTAVLMCTATPPAFAADRAKTAMSCTAAADLVYECTLEVTNARTGVPIEGAKIVLGADMPSMPMVHNMPPVEFQASGTPGQYKAKFPLDMRGAWAIRLRISGPLRDEVVNVYEFGEKDATLRGRASSAPVKSKSGHGHHRH
jgi:hypothetical protein